MATFNQFYSQMKSVGTPGQTDDEVKAGYKQWTSTFEQDHASVDYNGGRLVARFLGEEFDEQYRQNVKVLDLGAGTGIVGKELKAAGFKHVDGLDPSEAMLEKARESDRYENYIVAYVTGDRLDIPDGAYDAVTASGIFGLCHVPTQALPEIIRLVKKGGFVVSVARLEVTTDYEMYADLEPTMDALEAEGKWRRLCRDTSNTYYSHRQAIVWKYQVL